MPIEDCLGSAAYPSDEYGSSWLRMRLLEPHKDVRTECPERKGKVLDRGDMASQRAALANFEKPLLDLSQAYAFYEHLFFHPLKETFEETEFRLIRHRQPDAVTLAGDLSTHYVAIKALLERGYRMLEFVRSEDGEMAKVACDAAELFESLLSHSLQGYDEVQVRKPEVISLWGTLEMLERQLVQLNADGYSVYIVVNQIKKAAFERQFAIRDRDVSSSRALFVDFDKPRTEGRLTNLGVLQAAPLPPSLIVQSSLVDKVHGYWLVWDLKPSDFKYLQQRLVQFFQSDPSVCNAAQLMRHPGFAHTKGKPVLTRLLEDDGAHYTLKQILDGFDIQLRPGKRSYQPTIKRQETPKGPRRKAQISGGDIPNEIMVALQGHKTLEAYLVALKQVWPVMPSFRHSLAVCAASDLYRHGLNRKAAEQAVRKLCKQAGDEEVSDRLMAVHTTYSRIERGEVVAGLARSGACKTNYPVRAWGKDLRTLPPRERTGEAERRIVQALVRGTRESDGSWVTTMRKLAEQTGVNKNTVSKTLSALSERGDIKTFYDSTAKLTRIWKTGESIVSVRDSVETPPSLLLASPEERRRLEQMRSSHAAQRRAYRSFNDARNHAAAIHGDPEVQVLSDVLPETVPDAA